MGAREHDDSCIFCKMIDRQIPCNLVAEGEEFFAIRDINPQAPTHILVLPKDHFADIRAVEDAGLLGRLFQHASSIAADENLGDGFRLVVNTGLQAGQTVFHLHIHLLGGRDMHWPPG